ncbi:MAG: LemA family protein [Candidatus Gracilibacteria bacterium]|nr:LemA family protein [Candidatus Gracilibacteria bacterium]
MNLIIVIRIVFLIISSAFIAFLYMLENKINLLESKIRDLFKKRTNLAPALFEISKHYIEKETEVFAEINYLRKIEFYNSGNNSSFSEFLNNEKKIHYEIEFLFKVFDKKPKLQKDGKFLYLKDLIIESSSNIGKNISIYKNIIQTYNLLVNFKNLTIIGLIFPIYKKTNI